MVECLKCEMLVYGETLRTPYVSLSPKGSLHIKGRSIMEGASDFYESLFDWLDIYLQQPARITVMVIQMEFLNPATIRYLLRAIRQLNESRSDLKVFWIYDSDDEDMLETAMLIGELSQANIDYRTEETIRSN